MPLYVFLCLSCGKEFELFLRPSEADEGGKCPGCQGVVHSGSPAQVDAGEDATVGCGPGKVT